MWRQGLARSTPTSRLNVRLVAALRGFLDDLLTSRSRQRQLNEQRAGGKIESEVDIDGAIRELPRGTDDILDADIVEDDESPAKKTAAASTQRSGVRASAKERAAHWRAMTPAKLAKAEQMADDGATQAEIARKLGVSRSTVSRHLAGKSS
ncbi:MAG: Hin recombinase [Sporichthya sp.]|nr:Hin recombinase [Sporichthya sp.]